MRIEIYKYNDLIKQNYKKNTTTCVAKRDSKSRLTSIPHILSFPYEANLQHFQKFQHSMISQHYLWAPSGHMAPTC